MKKEIQLTHVIHEIEPVFDENSSVLILGSFPSVKSREGHFFYNHPQNRFWKVVAGLTGEAVPMTVAEKRAMLLRQHIAVWDVIHSCDINGSSDSSIKNVVPNDLNRILQNAPIQEIFANGGKSGQLYDRYCAPSTGRPCVLLPSTSPANASFSLERLMVAWQPVKEAQILSRKQRQLGAIYE